MPQFLMYWLPGTPVKTFDIPEGYSISKYKTEADKYGWVECCKNGLVGDDAGIEAFDECITNEKNINLFDDVFFIDYAGEHIATVTAFTFESEGQLIGDMHMVGIRTDFRGKGLGKILSMLMLQHLKDVPGLKYIRLTTDDWRRAAIKSYLSAGFLPVNCERFAVARWQAIVNDPAFKLESLQMLKPDTSLDITLKRGPVRGKIIAMGGGFGGEEAWNLSEAIFCLSGKLRPNYLYIPTTDLDMGGAGSFSLWAKMGCNCEVLYVTHPYVTEELIAEKIRNADIINVPGGNLIFCMEAWRKTNTVKYLKEAFDQGKVLFGSSSGSMCWFKKGWDDCASRDRFMFVDGCDIIPYCNVPHYENGNWNSYGNYAAKAKISTIACEDEVALCYLDGHYSVLVSKNRPDARAWFFDADDGYKRYDLTEHPEILEKL